MSLVSDPQRIRLAMLGMVEGNGHPFSWSAIINGRYDREVMEQCGYPVIPKYLGAEPPMNLGIDGAEVTHVWCDRREDTQRVARAALIPHQLEKPEEAIGEVDAAIIATDIGGEHLDRARPFIEAGVPVFIDKPLTDRLDHLRQFIEWHEQGRALMSTSAMRYSREFHTLRMNLESVGEIRLIVMTMCKSWERYGIHALEGVYGFLPPGRWEWVANTGTRDANIVHIRHGDGVDVLLPTIADMAGGYGKLQVCGTAGRLEAEAGDTYTAFRMQLEAFVRYLRTGRPPVDFRETVEQMKIVIAGIRSREAGGARVMLDDLEL